jgi:hypothetical protein
MLTQLKPNLADHGMPPKSQKRSLSSCNDDNDEMVLLPTGIKVLQSQLGNRGQVVVNDGAPLPLIHVMVFYGPFLILRS